VKQDLIDDEILESVSKTMKAKAQLLLKKMKSSLDVSWNEKGELKYKGEIVVFGEYGIIGEGLCCCLRDLCVLFV
jgi:hypothetical protein